MQQYSNGQQSGNGGLARNLTAMNLGDFLITQSSGQGGLNIEFYYAQVAVTGRGGKRLETRLHISKGIRGDRFTVSNQPITEEEAMREFPQEFAHFKKYQEMPSNGTPLHELPGISQSQIAMLTINGLRSVEDLATLSPDAVAQVGMEASHAQKLAKLWVAKKAGASETIRLAQIEAEHEAEKAEGRSRIEAMEAQNATLQRQIELLIARMGGQMAVPAGYGSQEAVAIDAAPDLPSLGELRNYAEEGPLRVDGRSDLADPLAD